VVREKLRQFVSLLDLPESQQGRVCCDTAPVDERYWAWRCGVGQWLDNAQIAVEGYGTFVFLGEWLCPLTIDQLMAHLDAIFPDEMDENAADATTKGNAPTISSCLSCGRCQRACPGGALSAQGLDARKCLSYLTIEHRGELPASVSQQMGQRIYGCDTCAEVCPVNRLILLGEDMPLIAVCEDFLPSSELLSMRPDDWVNLTVDQYRRLFKGSAVKRAKYEGLMRNIRAACGGDDVEGVAEPEVLM
jgi:epoxyqueuosine reductase